jgi:hypothetical protein
MNSEVGQRQTEHPLLRIRTRVAELGDARVEQRC